MSLGSGHRAIYSRELCCSHTGLPLVFNRAVDWCGDKVICDKVAIRQFYCLLDATADGLPATPCSFDAIRRRRGNRKRTRVRVWVAIGIGIKRPVVNQSEKETIWTQGYTHPGG